MDVLQSHEAHHLQQARLLNYCPPPSRPLSVTAPVKYIPMSCSGTASITVPVNKVLVVCPCPDIRADRATWTPMAGLTPVNRLPPLAYWFVDQQGASATLNNIAGAAQFRWANEDSQLNAYSGQGGASNQLAWDMVSGFPDFSTINGVAAPLQIYYPGTLTSVDPVDMIQGLNYGQFTVQTISATQIDVSAGSLMMEAGAGRVSATVSVPMTGSCTIASVGSANHPQQYGVLRKTASYDQCLTEDSTCYGATSLAQLQLPVAENTPDTVPTFYTTQVLNMTVPAAIAALGNVKTLIGASGTATMTTELLVTAKSRGFISSNSLGDAGAYLALVGTAVVPERIQQSDFGLRNGMMPSYNSNALISSGHGFIVVNNTSASESVTVNLSFDQEFYVQAPDNTAYFQQGKVAYGHPNMTSTFPAAPIVAAGATIPATPVEKAFAHCATYSATDSNAIKHKRILTNAINHVAPIIHAISPSLTKIADPPGPIQPQESAPKPAVQSTGELPQEVIHAASSLPNELLSKAASIAKKLPVVGDLVSGVEHVAAPVLDALGPVGSVIGDIAGLF